MTEKQNSEDEISEAIERELTRLVVMDHHHPDLVLGMALAKVMTLVSMRHGGDMAAAAARSAASKCQGLPAYADVPLAAMQPMGRA